MSLDDAKVVVSDKTHFGGMPSLKDVELRIGSITIGVSAELLAQMGEGLDNALSEKLTKAQTIYDRYWKNVERTQAMIKEVRQVFYDDTGDFCLLKSNSEIDFKQLDEVLQKNSKLFGFE